MERSITFPKHPQPLTLHEIFRACVLLLLFANFALAADTINCPATISARQQLASPVAGWSVREDDTPHNLAAITFFDGPPSDNASLVYDRIAHGKTEQVTTWTFAPQKERPIWLVCSYARTSIQLTKALPTTITMCTVTYDPQQTIDGNPAIKKIACK